MNKNLDITSRTPVQGIKSIGGHLTLNDFQNVTDPLAAGAIGINKPASSIPSMFARILFFRTAYQSVAVTPTATNTVYAKFVSDSLDLLEDLFNRKDGMELIQWNKEDQLDALKSNPVLRKALNSQLTKFLPTIQDIILIKDNNTIIGGTSPFTVVYTSPNWNNSRPTKMLVTRTPKFREFMYKLADAFNNVASMREFILFINNSKMQDETYRDEDYAGQWSPETLSYEYPPYQLSNDTPAIIDPSTNLILCGRNTNQFSSDLFLNSTIKHFDEAKTPLFLKRGISQGLYYYDDNKNVNIQFEVESEKENGDEIEQTLPGCTFKHRYITPIYFLEENLLKVPYRINSERWSNVIEVDGGSCFIPLKPLFFKYFKINDLKTIFSFQVDSLNKKVTVILKIPVRNNKGTRNNNVEVKKEYLLDNIKSIDEFDNYFTIGVSPFYRSGRHFVLRQEAGSITNCDLEFYNVGEKNPIDSCGHTRNEETASRTTYYEVKDDFDFLRVSWPTGHGVLVPRYRAEKSIDDKTIKSGNEKYYYGVDFGTTNSHIAFTHTTGNSAQSFHVNEFALQLEYLSADGKTGDENGVLLTDAAREFLPSNHDSSFSFPIRTVVSNVGELDVNSKMFNDISIGFRYSKEYTQMPFYYKDLKWDFNHSIIAPEVLARVRIFCEELLWIIKNHWMLQEDAKHTETPEIRLTYPLAMGNWKSLLQVWQEAYVSIFGVDLQTASRKIESVTESLAPCRNAMNKDSATSQGILNIDMGGGSTDLQYYFQSQSSTKSIYCSVLFAGDDLWGKGYEHTGSTIGKGVTSNAFTRFADEKLKNAQIVVGSKAVSYPELRFSDPKEKIDCLLKDTQHNFTNALQNPQDNACRKIMYVHYASILWHVAKWLKANGVEQFPKYISFTGLASKYLDLLFDTDIRFEAFTKKLLSIFYEKAVDYIKITKEPSPKNITAEGAALYALDASTGDALPISTLSYHLGYDNYNPSTDGEITFDNVATKKQVVMDSLKKFLEDFNTVGDCEQNLTPQQVVRLTTSDINGLMSDASESFDQMCTIMNRSGSINDSLFFWALKDSLWKIGTH